MRVVIVGGSGLIGRALCRSLAKDGHQVIISSRHPEMVLGLPQAASVSCFSDSLVNGADAVINLAGENIGASRWTPKRKQSILQSRVQMGRAVSHAIAHSAQKPHVLVQASGVGYYGPSTLDRVTEDSPPGGDYLGRLAVEWEASTLEVEALGVRRVIVRTGVVLSREGGALPRLLLPYRFLIVGCHFGSGKQWVPWVHIADEVGAIRFLIEREDAMGPFNVCSPHPLTNAELSNLLGQQLRRSPLIKTPSPLLRLVFGEMATVLLEGQRAIPARLLQLGYAFRFAAADAALKNILT